jgi:hypothetical protein
MILESIITTINEDGTMHISAIGPHVDREFDRWELKPFLTSKTCQNLRRTDRCVIHIVDDALLMAQVVSRQTTDIDASFEQDFGFVINDACRAFGLTLSDWQIEEPRGRAQGQVVWQKELRPFWGWNRAKHAILELAVVATRVGILPVEEIEESIARTQVIVQKTAGSDEELALALLVDFIAAQLAQIP